MLSLTAHRRVTGPIVLAAFRAAAATYGPPASALTDNGMVFTTRLSGGRGGWASQWSNNQAVVRRRRSTRHAA